jgi:hypothetical protein
MPCQCSWLICQVAILPLSDNALESRQAGVSYCNLSPSIAGSTSFSFCYQRIIRYRYRYYPVSSHGISGSQKRTSPTLPSYHRSSFITAAAPPVITLPLTIITTTILLYPYSCNALIILALAAVSLKKPLFPYTNERNPLPLPRLFSSL